MRVRRYAELRTLETFDERFDYLDLRGQVGDQTFGFDRWMNQAFYQSAEWRLVRLHVINRDRACDLGIPGYDIHTDLLVHHMNPISAEDLEAGEQWIVDPEFLITTTKRTHNAIHFGGRRSLPQPVVERARGDTSLW